MKYALALIHLLTLFFGLAVLLWAKSSIHEIEGGILLLISIIALGSASVINAIERLREDIRRKVD